MRVLRAMQLSKPGMFLLLMVKNQAELIRTFYFATSILVRLNFYLPASMLCFAVLLEGSPGVGKTSLITAMGKISGHKVVRINLCEQVSGGSHVPFLHYELLPFFKYSFFYKFLLILGMLMTLLLGRLT